MPSTSWSPRIVPYGADQTVYLVIDRFRGLGTVYRDAFNTLEHWSEDVTEYIAFEIQARCDIEGAAVPEHIQDFVESFTGPDRQLALRLV